MGEGTLRMNLREHLRNVVCREMLRGRSSERQAAERGREALTQFGRAMRERGSLAHE
ncbi:MAG: hypothetical protein J7M19_08200 [Planctomycetes bacterium]|nr:hypothetical protein [Planctomycetota bacterium]